MSHPRPFRVVILLLGMAMSSLAVHAQSPTDLRLVLADRPGGLDLEAVVPDGSGGVWAVGSGSIDTTADAVWPTPLGGRDGYLFHMRADGVVVYATYLGGSRWDLPYALALDRAGNIYVAGETNSSDFPVTPGAYDRQCGADGSCIYPAPNGPIYNDAFVMKLDPSGRQLLYATYLGGRASDTAYGIAVDASGVAHVVGSTMGAGFPMPAGSACETMGGAFYTRIAADGATLPFSRCMEDGIALGITLDPAGNAYLVGNAGEHFPRANGFKMTYPAGAGSQAFLAMYTPSDQLEISTYLGGSGSDYGYGVAVTSKGVYVTGSACSTDFPGAPPRDPQKGCAAYVTKIRLDGVAILATTILDGTGFDSGRSIAVDANEVVHVAGSTASRDFPVTGNAQQIASGGPDDAFLATIWMPNNVGGDPGYVTYLGGSSYDYAQTLALDGAGGVWIGGLANSADFPSMNSHTAGTGSGFITRYASGAPPPPPPVPSAGDIVIHPATTATATVGYWLRVDDATAAGGARMWNPDGGIPKIPAAAANPPNYFEVTFDAQAGVPYHLWVRMKADNDYYQNDSIYVQFSDAVNGSGAPIWRIGSTSATMVSLEDCSGCGEHGWGWNDNGYDTPATRVMFATSGPQTLRVQQREDGISIDQIVLSSGTWIDTSPGTSRDDTTIVPAPPPPPSNNPDEIVLYAGAEAILTSPRWTVVSDSTAAAGKRLFNPNLSEPRPGSPLESADDYVEVRFQAKAGVPYHLWVRAEAQANYYGNDSVYVQFSGSVDAAGAPTFRIGTASATNVILEDCIGCGEAGWGWQDNAYSAFAAPIYFATSGVQTIRLLRREDGISIDQIVLSSSTYFTNPPGPPKNDSTIVPK